MYDAVPIWTGVHFWVPSGAMGGRSLGTSGIGRDVLLFYSQRSLAVWRGSAGHLRGGAGHLQS